MSLTDIIYHRVSSLINILNKENVLGISIGALSMIVPIYQSEISTREVRGRLVSLQQLAITIGIAISYWIN
jgi:MFS family permease